MPSFFISFFWCSAQLFFSSNFCRPHRLLSMQNRKTFKFPSDSLVFVLRFYTIFGCFSLIPNTNDTVEFNEHCRNLNGQYKMRWAVNAACAAQNCTNSLKFSLTFLLWIIFFRNLVNFSLLRIWRLSCRRFPPLIKPIDLPLLAINFPVTWAFSNLSRLFRVFREFFALICYFSTSSALVTIRKHKTTKGINKFDKISNW